jgi:hypothetical protein
MKLLVMRERENNKPFESTYCREMAMLKIQGWRHILELFLANNQLFQGLGGESFRCEGWSCSLLAFPDPVVRENCLPRRDTSVLFRITIEDEETRYCKSTYSSNLWYSVIMNSGMTSYSDLSTASMTQEALMDEIWRNSKLGTV